MSVHVKIMQEIKTNTQVVQVFNDELGGMLLVVREGDNYQDYKNLYLTKAEAKALAGMLSEVASK
jgi:surface antigen